MADKVLSSGDFVRPFRSPWGGYPIRAFGVSTGVSSAIIWMGRQVTLDPGSTNQQYVKASTATATNYIVGYAAETTPSTVVAGTKISVWEAHPDVEFRAVTKNGLIDSTSVGEVKAVVWDSTLNIQYIDLAESTAAKRLVVITQLIDNPGDSGGYVAFRHNQDAGIYASSLNSTTPLLAFYR